MDSLKSIIATNFGPKNPTIKSMNSFTQVNNSIFRCGKDLNIYEKMILMVLLSHCIGKIECWPSHETIAKEASCSITTVKKTIRSLEEKKLLKIIPNSKFRSCLYIPSKSVYRRDTTSTVDATDW